MQRENSITPLERFLSAGSYLTLGVIGMIWFIINAFLFRRANSKYLVLNLVQSFIICIIFSIISLSYSIFIGILINLPLIGKFFLKMHILLFSAPIFATMSFINYVILLFLIYLSFISIFGKLPYVPFVTDIAKKMYS
ncbi:MAG: hypothetical protein LUE64_00845 [Candidatus Gastranaerophilales bacterium]|nr:hypothetical protein [Candidatus Gastranaerophilales bacterium]